MSKCNSVEPESAVHHHHLELCSFPCNDRFFVTARPVVSLFVIAVAVPAPPDEPVGLGYPVQFARAVAAHALKKVEAAVDGQDVGRLPRDLKHDHE